MKPKKKLKFTIKKPKLGRKTKKKYKVPKGTKRRNLA